MTLDEITRSANPHGLDVLGIVPANDQHGCMVLLGPAADFWTVFASSAEALDNLPDPIDRWSARILAHLTSHTNARAILPFGGPPFAPFLTYAQNSGRAWPSHVGMLVHDSHGLLISYRGALEFDENIAENRPKIHRPCDACSEKPCAIACPVNALTPDGYDVASCKEYLKSSAGADCLNKGCAVRRICPISKGANRSEAQSALHMHAFIGA